MRNNRKSLKPHGFFLGLISALVLAILVGSAWLMMDTLNLNSSTKVNEQAKWAKPALAQEQVMVTLQKTYVCGVEEEEKVTKTVSSSDQLFKEYSDWELVSKQDNRYVFKKLEHDLAPMCKEHGYFGLTDGEVLTLFEGPPQEQKVIQTFFQINTDKFESGLFQNDLDLLKQGIRIHDLAEYNSILSTYGEYSDESLSSHHRQAVDE
ncbi:hypothetical protein BEP19_05680 [Ammoniphilus oxalaticus]|uniref:Bypass of forespore C C-terminal domain-containing protein n=1 Tax=Ammoniphilus oxalaticus TaxID=66863 RepID=A0A419SIZ0_9BACL|nr:BofC C-terminal domain-containing protein [Ammoniphilus oxalaticus]RKD23916.1 hypothetical protein BEP19_05680 [Ammoniphilus oxalaticus]